MQKYVYIIWRPDSQPTNVFRKYFLETITPSLLDISPLSLAVSLTEPGMEGIEHPRADSSRVSGLVSIKVASSNMEPSISKALYSAGSFIAGYDVDEAIPLDYKKTWHDGEITPGISQVTFLRRRQGMVYDDFIHYWHHSHTPLALEIHPLWRYVRNVVKSPITPDAPNYDGIVELLFKTKDDLTDLNRFFGKNVDKNMPRIAEDVGNFIDLNKIEVTNMTEFVLKS